MHGSSPGTSPDLMSARLSALILPSTPEVSPTVLRFPHSRRRSGAAPVGPGDRAEGQYGLARLPLVLGIAALGVLGGGTTALLAGSGSPLSSVAAPHPSSPRSAPAPTPVLALAGQSSPSGTVPWSRPLRLTVTRGTVKSVSATGPSGAVAGTLSATGWTGTGTLLPSSDYHLHAVLADRDGKVLRLDRTVRSSAPGAVLHPTLSPDGYAAGVGQPVVVQLDQPVTGEAARSALLKRLTVTTSPAVEGAWHFYNSYEVHYRPQTYWNPGTTVSVTADLRRFRLPGTSVWGNDTVRRSSFTIGDALVSTVDITAHTMIVTRNGQPLKTVNVSTGRDKYPTKGGVHIVLSVNREQLYDSATVGIPRDSPDGYYEKLPFSMRISNGGAFVHANPATVKFQGRLNVSHGCVNLSLADAQWFYSISHRGDIVNVIHAVVAPVLTDAGMADWNYSWADWKAGNL